MFSRLLQVSLGRSLKKMGNRGTRFLRKVCESEEGSKADLSFQGRFDGFSDSED